MQLMDVTAEYSYQQKNMMMALEAIALAGLPVTVHGSAALLVLYGSDTLITSDLDVDWLSLSIEQEYQEAVVDRLVTALRNIGIDARLKVKHYATKDRNAVYRVFSGDRYLFKFDIAYKITAQSDYYKLPSGNMIKCQSIPSLIADRVCSISCQDFEYRVKDMCTLLLVISRESGFTQMAVLEAAEQDSRKLGRFTEFDARTKAASDRFDLENRKRHYTLTFGQQIELITPFLQPFKNKYVSQSLTWDGRRWRYTATGKPYDNQVITFEENSVHELHLK